MSPIDGVHTNKSISWSAGESRIHSLDGLRAASITIVIASHFTQIAAIPSGFGVTVFFVISDFLITRLLLAEYDRTGTIDLLAFYRRRAFRLLPAILVAIVMALAVQWLTGVDWVNWQRVAASLLFYQNYWGGGVRGILIQPPSLRFYDHPMMTKSLFRYFKTSPEIIQLTVMMYTRYPLSLRHVEDLLHERGIDISYESVHHWRNRFGPFFAAKIKKRRIQQRCYSVWCWHVDEVFVKIAGETHYLWRAIDHEGEVLEAYVTKARDKAAALKFLRRAMKRYGSPKVIVTDGLASYGAAMKEIGNQQKRDAERYLNNRIESSHLPFRRRERAMQRFRRMRSLQKFTAIHSSISNHFNLDRHLISRATFKTNREAALQEWRALIAA